MRLMWCLLFLFGSGLSAAEPDPFSTLDVSANIDILIACERQLNAVGIDSPTSIVATDRALMAMVNLALDDDVRWGSHRGLDWGRRAEALQATMAKRGLDLDPRPALWLDVLAGRTEAAVERLQELGIVDTPHGRALRLFATGDYRAMAQRDPLTLTAHEFYCLAHAYERSELSDAIADLPARVDQPAIGWTGIRARTLGVRSRHLQERHQARVDYVWAALGHVGQLWHFESPLMAPHFKRYGPDVFTRLSSRDGWQRIEPGSEARRFGSARMQELEESDLFFAWTVCRFIYPHASPLRLADGRWNLIDGPLWARKCRRDLFRSGWQWHAFVRHDWQTADYDNTLSSFTYANAKVVEPEEWRSTLPGGLFALIDDYSPEKQERYEQVVATECADSHGLGLAVLAPLPSALRQLPETGYHYPHDAVSALRDAYEVLPPAEQRALPILAGMEQLLSSRDEDVQAAFTAASASDPWGVLWRTALLGNDRARRERIRVDIIEEEMPWRLDVLFAHAFQLKLQGSYLTDQRRRNRQGAIALMRTGLEIHQGHPDLHATLGHELFNAHQFADCRDVLLDFQQHSRDRETMSGQSLLGRAYEELGDLVSAEAWYRSAVQEVASDPVSDYGLHLYRQQRYAEARAWFDLDWQHHRQLQSFVLAKACLYADSTVPDTIAAAICAEVDPNDLIGSAVGSGSYDQLYAFNALRRHGGQRSWLVWFDRPEHESHRTRFYCMLAHLDLGHFQRARHIAHDLLGFVGDDQANYLQDNQRATCWLIREVTGALLDQPRNSAADWQRMRVLDDLRAPLRLAISVISGERTREAGLSARSEVKDGDELLYWLGFLDLSEGHVEQAREKWQNLDVEHPDWYEAASARSLLHWMDRWSPYERARWGSDDVDIDAAALDSASPSF